jgi:L-ribulose-5-phosphate 3-epimerase
MDRRGFMAGLAAAGLGAALVARSRGGEPERVTLPIRKAVKIGMIAGGTGLVEKFAIAREAGFAGVELDAPADLDSAEVAEAKTRTGIVVPGVVNSVHWAKPLNHPEASVREEGVAGLEAAVRSAAAWCTKTVAHGPTVLLVPAVVRKEMSYAEAWRLSMEGILRVMPLARELGVRVAIENVWNEFLLSPVEAARYSDEINERAGWAGVGWHFDIGNVWRYGWPEHWIAALGPRIWRLDVKGYSRAKADETGKWSGFGVEIGEGDLDWAAVRGALSRIGYRGWAAAEVRGGDAARLREVSERMDRVLGLGGSGSDEEARP